MSRAAPEPSRPLTRSMASSTVRRSARLKNVHGEQRTSSPPPFPIGQTAPSTRRGPKKRTKSPPVPGGQSQSRKECGGIEAQPQPRLQRPSPRQSLAPGGSSVRTTTSSVCSRTGSSRVKELEHQLDVALQAKKDLAAQLREHKITAAQSTLRHLEDYFTCPLCFEILACPYAITPRNCGHTFCATCILKWFFSRLHKGCGGWHDAVDCPLCRTPLPHTPERTPRSSSSFPFTPNRTADIAVRGLMDAILHELDAVSIVAPSSLSDWNADGYSKREWSKRDRAGRTEMSSIATQWSTLKPTDFVNIKNRLEV